MKVSLHSTSTAIAGKLSIRCPHCGHVGTFEPVQSANDISTNEGYTLGIRRCPNRFCHGHLFFIMKNNAVIESFPPLRIDFNSDGVPEKVKQTFEEAITCHANKCYIASAIMIRRTLEEICYERGATGDNLKAKIASLKSKVILPQELLEAADDLRLLGNDAAHIESKEFNEISEKEISISILLTKEIIKSLYQYKTLLTELKSLKKN